jgi:hypothetical protein
VEILFRQGMTIRIFLSDIDPNNIQYKFENSNSSFLKVQQEYNKAVMDGRIDPKSEFISNNGGIDQIRNNIITMLNLLWVLILMVNL